MESVDSVAEEPVSSTLKLAVSAISAKQKNKGLVDWTTLGINRNKTLS